MQDVRIRSAIMVVVMAVLVGCGKGSTSSAGMAAGVMAVAVGGIAGAAATLKKRSSLDTVELVTRVDRVDLSYTNQVSVPVDRVEIDVPGGRRNPGVLQYRPRRGSGERSWSDISRRDLLGGRGIAR